MFFQNFNIIGFAARELHLLEVKGVELSIFLLKSGQNRLLFQGITLTFKSKNV
jgi:hypothetical protein